jgi:hypothetical protein
MKGNDKIKFILIIVLSLIIGFFFSDKEFTSYSDIITFLSILLGFTITSISILFNSRILNLLFHKINKDYRTELHRLKDYFKSFLYFSLFSLVLLIICPDKIQVFCIKFYRSYLIYPILFGSVYSVHKIAKDIFRIFVIPRNENPNNNQIIINKLNEIIKLLKQK